MLRVLEYWLDDDPQLMEELAAIRKGAGHLDLANDLEQLADIHQRPLVRGRIEHDTEHADSHDIEHARSLARSIFSGLGLSLEKEHRRWTDLCQRAWTLLRREYAKHRTAGMFLMQETEDVEQTYPSLVTVARTARTSSTQVDNDAPVTDTPASTLEIAAAE